MMRGKDRAGPASGRAILARLLALAFLLASLLVPPLAGAAAAPAAMTQGGTADAPARPDGILHAGTHCVCQVADRLTPPLPPGPSLGISRGRPAFTDHVRASRAAEPPARPPRA